MKRFTDILISVLNISYRAAIVALMLWAFITLLVGSFYVPTVRIGALAIVIALLLGAVFFLIAKVLLSEICLRYAKRLTWHQVFGYHAKRRETTLAYVGLGSTVIGVAALFVISVNTIIPAWQLGLINPQGHQVYLADDVVYFNPSTPPKSWDDEGLITTSTLDTVISFTTDQHGLVSAQVGVVASPYSTELVERFLFFSADELVEQIQTGAGYDIKFFWNPIQSAKELRRLTQLAHQLEEDEAKRQVTQDWELDLLVTAEVENYLKATEKGQLQIKALSRQLESQLKSAGWQVTTLEVKAKTNNWL